MTLKSNKVVKRKPQFCLTIGGEVYELNEIAFNGQLDQYDIFDFTPNGEFIKLAYKSSYISFCAIELPYTCGLIEIGQLNATNGVTQQMFNKLMKEIIRVSEDTFIVNTVRYCTRWETLLNKCPYFNYVKKYRNPRTGNYITTWISTNYKEL